jgi:hypothetical protein
LRSIAPPKAAARFNTSRRPAGTPSAAQTTLAERSEVREEICIAEEKGTNAEASDASANPNAHTTAFIFVSSFHFFLFSSMKCIFIFSKRCRVEKYVQMEKYVSSMLWMLSCKVYRMPWMLSLY